jgi:hypothetical protein
VKEFNSFQLNKFFSSVEGGFRRRRGFASGFRRRRGLASGFGRRRGLASRFRYFQEHRQPLASQFSLHFYY